MVRKDKKNRKCIYCDKTFAIFQKLCQHYKSNKNQCRLAPDDIPKQALALETSSQKEKPKVINQTPDPEAEPGPSTQAHKEGQMKNPPHMNRNQPIFVRTDGKYFITNEDAKKWDQEQHNPEETRLPTLMELEKEDRLANEKVIENLLLEKR